jgi:uracil-DNA glycosylase
MFDQLHPGWQALLAGQSSLLSELQDRFEADSEAIPAESNLLRAFQISPDDYRVVIVGQDPYPNPNHATGLAFDVPAGTSPLPPTLRNILRELGEDIGAEQLTGVEVGVWATRGVMLLNRHLSTRSGESAAHLHFGWDRFTDAALSALAQYKQGKLVAILWGSKAQELTEVLGESRIIASAHPSPLSSYRGFFGSRPFSSCNKQLLELGLEPVDWSL